MRLLLFTTLLMVSIFATAQIDQSLIYSKWYLSKLEVQGMTIDKSDKRGTIHSLLEMQRNNGTEISEADSLNVAVEMEKMFKKFDDVYMEFKKNGTAIFNMGDLKDKDDKSSSLIKAQFEWKGNNKIITKEENKKDEAITVLELSQTDMVLEFADEEQVMIFGFKRK